MQYTNFVSLVSVDDLKANTEYSGYSIASPVIQWFWEIVQGFSKEDKARFLQFVTGTSKLFAESTYYFLNFEAIVFFENSTLLMA